MSNTADFTQGSILKKLCRFMLPVLGALILQAAYGAVDLLVVGRFGSTSGLSAVSTGSQVLNLVTFVVTQLAMGVTVLIARYIGEKREKEIGAVLGGAAVVFTILAGCLFVLLVLFARPISVLMQAPQEALALTASYVRICGCGILFIVAYNVLSAVFRGLGDSRSPLLFVLVACLSMSQVIWCSWPVCIWMRPVRRSRPCSRRRSALGARSPSCAAKSCRLRSERAMCGSMSSADAFSRSVCRSPCRNF